MCTLRLKRYTSVVRSLIVVVAAVRCAAAMVENDASWMRAIGGGDG